MKPGYYIDHGGDIALVYGEIVDLMVFDSGFRDNTLDTYWEKHYYEKFFVANEVANTENWKYIGPL